jgi:cobalt-zinc-cadmium efflux system membrane fusion protein
MLHCISILIKQIHQKMKNAGIITLLMLLIFLVSCNNNETNNHSHEADVEGTVHTHEADTSAAHTHEADASAAHTHEADAEAANTHDETEATGSTISFPYKSVKLLKQSFHIIKKTSGELSLDKKGEVSIIAKSSGIVHFNDSFLYPGIKLDKGELIFTVDGESLTEDNTGLNFARVEADYKKSKSDFERASLLIEEKLITQAHYLEIKNEFEKADAEYKVYLSSVSGGSSSVKTPQSGYLNEIYVREGDKVKAGEKLASIQTENHMVLRADIPPNDFDIIDKISAAKFAFGYSMKVYNTEEMGGKLISRGRSSDINSFYIPVFFKIDYDENLIPGTFADVWLIGDEIKDVIVIPNTSILEEFGKYYVYIDYGDHFDKRYIMPGRSDGEKTHVLTGLAENESIVSDGVYQVKMSMMTSIPNTHDHSH